MFQKEIIAKQSNKKNKNQQQFDPSVMKSYCALPFQAEDIVELFPTLKTLDIQNQDVRSGLQSAKQAMKDGYLEKAFELYSQCINSLLQISGSPMNVDVANAISKLASI